MKICVTSQGPDLAANVNPRFDRARFFILHDDETGQYEVVDNKQNVNAAGGAGIQSATTVAEKDCEWVVSGQIGPRAFSVFQEAGIRVATGANGRVADVLQDFKSGRLKEANAADANISHT